MQSTEALPFRSSLPARLALIFALFVAAIGTVRVLSIDHLVHVDATSGQIRTRWLEATRQLGNLELATAGVRIAEGEALLADTTPPPDTLPARLDAVRQALERYRALLLDSDETIAFGTFTRQWAEHETVVKDAMAARDDGRRADAVALFNGTGAATFQRATDDLRQLHGLARSKADAARLRAKQAIADARRWISDLIAGTLILFLALAAYLWWGVSRPLLELGRITRRLASNDTAIDLRFEGRRDEIGAMARALAVLRRNTVELLEARRRLSDQAEALIASLAMERTVAAEQRNFIHTISHEFRTPLTVIDGHAQRLIATSRDDRPDVADRAEKIRAAVFGMTNLVGSLSDAVELSYRDLEARMRPFDLDHLLRTLGRYYLDIGAGGSLTYSGGLTEPVTGDPTLLHQVFSNLLSNAFKYSPEKANVTMTAARGEDGVVVTIEDHGRGIPQAELDRVGERYFRAGNVGSIPGTGMGLHLVNAIVRAHGGRLQIESQEGVGTRVTVVLPGEGTERLAEPAGEQHPVRGGRSGDSEPAGGGAAGAGAHG